MLSGSGGGRRPTRPLLTMPMDGVVTGTGLAIWEWVGIEIFRFLSYLPTIEERMKHRNQQGRPYLFVLLY